MPRWIPLVALALVLSACAADDATDVTAAVPENVTSPPLSAPFVVAEPVAAEPGTGELVTLGLELVTDGLETPVAAVAAPGDARLFILEQPGRIRIVLDGELLETPYLDIVRFVEDEGLEQGLLGMAFHPDFATNGRVFVSFTNVDGHSRIIEYTQSSANPNALDTESAQLVYGLDQPHEYHNGGTILFGPDGNLWAGFGDGGSVGDPWKNGQDPFTPLGTVVRIDVDGGEPYAIPTDNPFADGERGAPEVWAYGLRNPWRITFTDDALLIADVGHDFWEEVNVSPLTGGGGENYGWPVAEGPDCWTKEPEDGVDVDCDKDGFARARLELFHRRLCAIVGGPIYRGAAIPELHGHYFFGDFCVGWVRSAPYEDGAFGDDTQWSDDFGELGQVTSLSEDATGEIVVTYSSGEVYRIVPIRE